MRMLSWAGDCMWEGAFLAWWLCTLSCKVYTKQHLTSIIMGNNQDEYDTVDWNVAEVICCVGCSGLCDWFLTLKMIRIPVMWHWHKRLSENCKQTDCCSGVSEQRIKIGQSIDLEGVKGHRSEVSGYLHPTPIPSLIRDRLYVLPSNDRLLSCDRS